jgi:hypothetical protein
LPILFSRQAQPAYICLPSQEIFDFGFTIDESDETSAMLVNRKSKMAARVGLAPTPCGLTNRRATLTPPGIRIWRCRQDSHLHRSV